MSGRAGVSRALARSLATGALALVLAAAPTRARADSGALFGESSRVAALAGSAHARDVDTGSIGLSPGSLAFVEAPVGALTAHAGRLDLWFQRSGEPREDRSRTVGGFAAAFASPLPGPAPLRAFRLGVALHVPAGHVLRIEAPSRRDEPSFPLYGGRAERTAATATLAVRLFGRIGVGAGLTLVPRLTAPSAVRYDPTRGDVDENVVVALERDLRLGAAPLFGVRSEVTSFLSLAVAYRGEVALRATGSNDVVAGSLVVRDPLDLVDFVSPEQLALGAVVGRPNSLTVSADLVRSRWSSYRTIHGSAPPRPFEDVVDVRLGAEWAARKGVALRAGYALEPSPVPAQDGETNLLDASRHVLALGGGLDLRAFDLASVRVDVHGRAHLLGEQTADKDVERLGDSDALTPGRQVGNLGYPGFSAGGGFWQLGLTLSWFGGEPAPKAAAKGAP